MKVDLIAMNLDRSAISSEPMDLGTFVDQAVTGSKTVGKTYGFMFLCNARNYRNPLEESKLHYRAYNWHEFCYFWAHQKIESRMRAVARQDEKTKGEFKMKLSKTILAVLGAGLLSCALFGQQAQGAFIQGNINFAGSVQFDTQSLATATRVNTWFDVFHTAGFSSVTGGATGDFAGILPGTSAAMAQPWIFNPSTNTPALWSVGGFTFDLSSSTVVNQTTKDLTIEGMGTVSGNGFDATPMTWMFTSQNAGGQNMQEFSFSANSNSQGVPDGGSTVALLGLGLTGVWMIRRKFVTA